jgi:ketosteroid isomerase-like protein
MIGMLLAAAVASDPAATLRSLRDAYNAALAAHDLQRMRAFVLDDYVVLPGSLGRPLAIGDYEARLARTFSDPTFVTYVRSPGQIVVSSSGKRASETGTWVGTWRKPDGEMRLSGIYQAVWAPVGASWKLRNESFVTLRCEGSRACPEVD